MEPKVEVVIRPKSVREYWEEFLRVNFDKIIVALLIVFMQATHAEEKLIYLLIGGLVGALTHNRWQRNP